MDNNKWVIGEDGSEGKRLRSQRMNNYFLRDYCEYFSHLITNQT